MPMVQISTSNAVHVERPSPWTRRHRLASLLIASCCRLFSGQAHAVPVLAASDGTTSQVIQLEKPWIGAFTIDAWINPLSDAKGTPSFDISTIDAADGSGPLVKWTMADGTLHLTERKNNKWIELETRKRLPANAWSHVAAVQDVTGTLLLFVNGKLEGSSKPNGISHEPMGAIRVGVTSQKLKSVRWFAGPLSNDAIEMIAKSGGAGSQVSPNSLSFRTMESPQEELVDYSANRLKVAETAEFPLDGGLLARAAVIPGRPGELPGLMTYSRAFGAGRMYFPGPPATSPPVGDGPAHFQQGKFLPRITIEGTVCFDPMFPCNLMGRQGMVTAMRSPATGLTELFFLPHSEKDPLTFEAPQTIPCGPDSKPFGLAFEGYALSYFGDIDQDGTPDLLLTKSESTGSYYPDYPKNFWSGEELPNSGPGKGYTANGVWLGQESVHSFHWVRGERTSDGQLRFGAVHPIFQGPKDYQLRWKGYFGAHGAAMNIGGKPYLILLGDLDRVLAAPFEVRDGAIHCEPPKNLLADNARLLQCYITSQVNVADMDGDGAQELVISGNPGSVAILHGREVGGFRELQTTTSGGTLAMQSLIIPYLADWDGDGQADLVSGDASGWLMCWPGTKDPKVFGKPEYFTVAGKPIHIQAGYAGSIQGPNEARWGYLNPAVLDWNGDGQREIISCDINGDLFLWRRGASKFELQPPERFKMNGKPLPVAWRQRVALAPSEDHLAGDDRICLFIQDYDGDLALAIPQKTGSINIERVEKLNYQDGQAVRTCGPAGCWGRSKFVWIDWDGDGKKDIIYSTNRASNRFITSEDIGNRSVPLFLKNVGTTSKPVFARPVPLKYKGEIFDFGTHISAVCPLPGTGSTTGGIIVGAEDGRVYMFPRKDITP